MTNPAIDPLREGLVMSLAVRLGKRGNLLEPGPGAYSQVGAFGAHAAASLCVWSAGFVHEPLMPLSRASLHRMRFN